MRLIDADKLIEPGYTNMFDEPIRFDMVSRYAIETAPTAKAIPIEWLKRYELAKGQEVRLQDAINEWEKENATEVND